MFISPRDDGFSPEANSGAAVIIKPVTAKLDFGLAGFSPMEVARHSTSNATTPYRSGSPDVIGKHRRPHLPSIGRRESLR
jgi:hypothetical protein